MFVVAAIPRLWAPDLVPFGRRQATYVATAERQAPVPWTAAYSDPNVSLLAVLEPILGYRPSSTVPWVVFRGLLDAAGVVLLYLAAKRLAGPIGGTLAALLYAVSPFAWALSRDPIGSIGPSLTAAVLLASVWLIARPSPIRGLVLGITLGLLARSLPFGPLVVVFGAVALTVGRAGWLISGITALALILGAGGSLSAWSRHILGNLTLVDPNAIQPTLALLLALPMGMSITAVRWSARVGVGVLAAVAAVTTVWMMHADSQTEWFHPAFVIRPPSLPWEQRLRPEAGGSLEWFPSYREAVALTTAMQEAAGRADASEIILLSNHLPEPLTPFSYGAMLDIGHTSAYSGNVPLPLKHETVFLTAAEGQRPGRAERAIELQRPSSSIRILTSQGADTGLELFTLRPRSAADWLARVHTVANGEFADGTRLVGVDISSLDGGFLDLSLYWEFHPPAGRRPASDRVRVGFTATPSDARSEAVFPAAESRRKDQLLLMQIRLFGVSGPIGAGPVRLTLLDERLDPIRTTTGDDALEVPLRGLTR